MRRRYFTITPYPLVDSEVHRGVAPLQVRRLPVCPIKRSSPLCQNDKLAPIFITLPHGHDALTFLRSLRSL